jgi:hypothetical protein
MKKSLLAALAVSTFLCSSAPVLADTQPEVDRYGGPTYTNSTDLPTTIAFLDAGGGPGTFSAPTALAALAGQKWATDEMTKLDTQYGQTEVQSFVAVFDFTMDDANKIATQSGIAFPQPALSGQPLAAQLISDGTARGTFWTGYLLGHLVTPPIESRVLDDVDSKFGTEADANYHKISNQMMYDLAQAIGKKYVMLAGLH